MYIIGGVHFYSIQIGKELTSVEGILSVGADEECRSPIRSVVNFDEEIVGLRTFSGVRSIFQGLLIDFVTYPVRIGQELTSGEYIWCGSGRNKKSRY